MRGAADGDGDGVRPATLNIPAASSYSASRSNRGGAGGCAAAVVEEEEVVAVVLGVPSWFAFEQVEIEDERDEAK